MKHFFGPIALSLLGAIVVLSALVVLGIQPMLARLAPPVLAITSPIQIQSEDLHPGDTLVLLTSHCVTSPDPVRVDYDRQYVSMGAIRRVVVLPRVSSTLQPGCETVETRTNSIPQGLPAGTWVLRGTAYADGKAVPFATVPFEVTSKETP